MAKKEEKIEVKKPEIKKVEIRKPKTVKDYYSIGEWRGLPQYKCNSCPFDSLNEKSIKEHVIDRHIPAPVRPKVEVKILDRFGNEVNK